MARQFLTVKFNEWDRRTYTYHNDGPRVEAGETIRVPTPRGPQIVKVETADVPAPTAYETKHICEDSPAQSGGEP